MNFILTIRPPAIALAGMLVVAVAAAAEPARNPSFEVPARATGQAAARGQVDGWLAEQAGVASNDGSWGAALQGVDGQQVGYLAAAANSQLAQDLPVGLTANSQHVFGIKVGSGATVAAIFAAIVGSAAATLLPPFLGRAAEQSPLTHLKACRHLPERFAGGFVMGADGRPVRMGW